MSDIRKENGKENGKEKGKESKLYTAQELATMVKSLRKEVRSLKTLVAEKDEELAAVKEQTRTLTLALAKPTVPSVEYDRLKADLTKQIKIKDESIEVLAKQNQILREALNKMKASESLATTSNQPIPGKEARSNGTSLNSESGKTNGAESEKEKLLAALSHNEIIRKELSQRLAALAQEKDLFLQDIQKLTKEKFELETQMEEVRRDNESLREELEDAKRWELEFQKSQMELRKCNAVNANLEDENSALVDSLTALALKVEELTLKMDATTDYLTHRTSGASRSAEDQQKLQDTVRNKFGDLIDDDEVVLDWFACAGGFMYVCSTKVLYDSPVKLNSQDCFNITTINSINKTSSSGLLPLPTLEFRLVDGTKRTYSGFVHRRQAMVLIAQRAARLKHEVQFYENGKKIDINDIVSSL